MTLTAGGMIGVGTYEPQYKLDVCGIIISTEEVIVELSEWCDFVFQPHYILEPFAERIQKIKNNKHLPHILSEKEILNNGLPMSQSLKGVVQNIEELYLYLERLENRISILEKENERLKIELEKK